MQEVKGSHFRFLEKCGHSQIEKKWGLRLSKNNAKCKTICLSPEECHILARMFISRWESVQQQT